MIFKDILKAWDEFWFQWPVEKAFTLDIFRWILCISLLWMAIDRQFDIPEYFSEKAIVSSAQAPGVFLDSMRPAFSWMQWPDAWNPGVHGLYIFGLLLVLFGIGGRPVILLTWVLNIAFLQRNWLLVYGADIIGSLFLLYLSLIGPQVWRWRRMIASQPDVLASVGARFVQLQLVTIYLFSGFEKLRGASWWDGTALWAVFANSQMVVTDLTWLRHFPLVIVLATWGTVLFEIFFPIFVWNKKWARLFLIAGIGFHLTIGLMIWLWSFALIMIAPYALFLHQTGKSDGRSFSLRRQVRDFKIDKGGSP